MAKDPVVLYVSGGNTQVIAWAGALMYKSGIRHKISETKVRQKFRAENKISGRRKWEKILFL